MLKKIMDMLQGMDKKTMEESVQRVQEYVATPEGKKLIESLQKNGGFEVKNKNVGEISEADKERIINEAKKNPELLKLIGNLFGGK